MELMRYDVTLGYVASEMPTARIMTFGYQVNLVNNLSTLGIRTIRETF
jgi:hypothetical protein